MANRAIELHDTKIEQIEHSGSNIILWLSAYMHESDGLPGYNRGTGWTLPARLIIENGTFNSPFSAHSLWITDGKIMTDDRIFQKLIPLALDERGKIRLFLSGAEGELIINGDRVYLEPTGQPVYVDDFPGLDEISKT